MRLVLTGPIVRRRLAVCLAAFFILFLVLTARLFYLQAIAAEDLQRRAQAQWTSESVIAPTRGGIYDRNGTALALSATAYTASASPRQVKDAQAFARALAPVLDMEVSEIVDRVSDTSKGGVTIKRQLTREVAQQVKTMMLADEESGRDVLSGLYLEEESRRYYPMGAFATQLLGLTTIDGVGQAGLESSLNDYLSGKAGSILEEIDGKGREVSYGAREYVPAVDGGSVTLTIDASIQSFAEQAAREAMAVNGAKRVRVLVMQPQTGEILALVCKPDYDLNDPPRDDVETLTDLMRNTVVSDAYEPGSTFKILTAAAALDAGVTNVSEGFYCSGSIYVEGGRIRCWGEPHGAETMAEALENSCNPVFVELGLRLGVERFYDYMERFGIGSATGVDIPGESSGIVIDESVVGRVDLARIGFGQSVAVTPIQLLTAACSVVNGGKLLKPYVVAEIRSEDGEVIERGQTVVRGQTISQQTSDTMRQLLQNVVTDGGGRNAYIEGYRVGGKTGTAQVYVDGVISADKHIGSFLGFAPMDDPQIAVLFIVDEADVPVDYGSTTAAPFARDVLEQSLLYLGVAPETNAEPLREVEVPSVAGLSVSEAVSVLKEAGLGHVLSGAGATVEGQLPAPGAGMTEGSLVMLYVEGEAEAAENDRVCVPDVSGMSVSAANRLLRSCGLQMRVVGSGVAVSQSPAARERVTPTTTVTVAFEPP